MVSRGPWIQDPDYTTVTAQSRTVQNNLLLSRWGISPSLPYYTEDREEHIGPPFPTEPYMRARDHVGSFYIGRESALNTGMNRFTYGTGGTVPVYSAVVTAEGGPSLGGVIGGQLLYEPAEWSENAIDIEYEDDRQTSDWLTVALHADTELRGDIFENTPEGSTTTMADPFTTTIQAISSATPTGGTSLTTFNTLPGDYAVVSATARRTLGTDIDLTSQLRDGDDKLLLSFMTNSYVQLHNPPDGVSSENRVWQYGWGLYTLRLRWTLRPPRYRWIYDTVPIRRTFPRDDSLAGGAGRTWPPPKSAQQSNRTFGGYI